MKEGAGGGKGFFFFGGGGGSYRAELVRHIDSLQSHLPLLAPMAHFTSATFVPK